MTFKLRRVVTGHDKDGRAIVSIDEIAKHVTSSRPGQAGIVVWSTEGQPIDNTDEADGSLCTGGKLHVKLLGINDFHGQLDQGKKVGTRFVGGADVLLSYLETAEAGIEIPFPIRTVYLKKEEKDEERGGGK